jgi:hypothetical protein
MKESSRIATPSIANCMASQYQYTLLQPYTYTYTVNYGYDDSSYSTCTAGWPEEWNRSAGICNKDIGNRTPRFTCNTPHEVGKGTTILESIRDYTSRTCFAGTLWVDGKSLKKATNTCIRSVGGTSDGDA